ncbi:MAG: hypothetical protein AAFR81_29530 [Chloroflexota bacterium]
MEVPFTPFQANIVLDVILIVISLWCVYAARGVGGVVGRTLIYIVIGIVILGAAHFQASLTADLFGSWNMPIHRIVVLFGFIFLGLGFRELQSMKR